MQDQQLSTFLLLLLFDAGSLCSFGACPGQAWTKRGQFTEGGGSGGWTDAPPHLRKKGVPGPEKLGPP